MPKRLRATLLHIVYSKSKKIAIVFIIFLEKSITLSLSSPLLLRISPHTFDFIPIPSMSLSSRKRSIFNAFRHILPCVAPLCEDMHYHKTGVPWQMNNTFIINENPPKIPYSAPIFRSLPSCISPVRLLNLSQNKQNAANRDKLRTSIVVKT